VDDYRLLVDLHRHGRRQGPGGDAETALAVRLARLDVAAPLKVADIGCGAGASALLLADWLNARITAVDLFPEFLTALQERARSAGTDAKISTLACSMENLPFADEALDVLWSEGAVYNIGFTRGVSQWRRYLRPGGVLAVSEITWLTDARPAELQHYWESAYSEIDTAAAKLRALERHGYAPLGYFVLPTSCWLDEYYRPLQTRFADFLDRHGHSAEARAIVAAEQYEIELYEKYQAFYGYGMYVARRL
jgi:ubiquinone/menaquinone biosynthesis C-methylase UbiE